MHTAPSTRARPGIRALLTLVSIASLSACSDSANPALAPQPSVEPSRATRVAPTARDSQVPDVVARRTLFRSAGTGAGTSRLTQTWTVSRPAGRQPALTLLARPGAFGKLDARAAQRAVPLGALRVAAAAASRSCRNAPEWRREHQTGGMRVVMHGRGDIPYTRLDVSIDGKPVGVVQAQWRRLRHSWLLMSHEFVSADGRVRDVVAFDHGAAALSRANPAVPEEACPGRGAAAGAGAPSSLLAADLGRSPFAGSIGSRTSLPDAFAGDAPEFGASECPPSEEEVEVACAAEVLVVVQKTAQLAAASAAMVTACLVPEPLQVPACVAAASLYAAAVADLGIAIVKYEECKAKTRKPPGGDASRPADGVTPVTEGSSASVTGAQGDGDGLRPSAMTCGDDGGGGGGGEGGGGGSWYQICEYVDHYDSEGNYLWTEDLGCYYVQAA